MPDLVLVLAVLIASLALVAVVALALAHRSVRPAERVRAVSGSELQSTRLAVRRAARRGGLASLLSVLVLATSSWIANTAFREVVGDGVFAAPILAGAIGIVVYGLLQSRPLIARPALSASLDARRPRGFAQTRSFVAVSALVVLLLALVVFAAVSGPGVATFVGPNLVVLIVLLGALVLAVVFALRRIAERAALPAQLSEADLAIRQIATRFVLLLAMSALLAPIGLVALQSGVSLWGLAAIDPAGARVDAFVGAAVTLVGALAAVTSVGSFIAVVLATAKHLHSSNRVAVQPAAVNA